MEVEQFNNIKHKNEKTKRKRRSKNDQDGRLFSCECGKSYLSQLALNNHKKSKHETQDYNEASIMRRGRGRPKKNVNIT
jgi:hypothetical protein